MTVSIRKKLMLADCVVNKKRTHIIIYDLKIVVGEISECVCNMRNRKESAEEKYRKV